MAARASVMRSSSTSVCRKWGLRRRSAPYPPSCSERKRRRRRQRRRSGWRSSTTRSWRRSRSPPAELAAWRRWQWAGSPLQSSSSSRGKRRKKRKRRKKKVPKTHSSSSLRCGAVHHVGPGEAASGMEEGNKLIEKKVVTGDIWEEIFTRTGCQQ